MDLQLGINLIKTYTFNQYSVKRDINGFKPVAPITVEAMDLISAKRLALANCNKDCIFDVYSARIKLQTKTLNLGDDYDD